MDYSTLPQPVTGNDSYLREQPGLEVAPDSGLQAYEADRDNKEPVAAANDHALAGAGYKAEGSSYPEVFYGTHPDADAALPAGGTLPEENSSRLKKNKKWLIIGAVALLVILAAILGGVLGSRASRKSNSAESDEGTLATAVSSPSATVASTSASASASATPGPKSIVDGSPLSAISFRTSVDGSPNGTTTGEVIVVLFKDSAGAVWASISQTFYGISDSTKSPWQEPQLITIQNPAQNGTGIAAAGYVTAYKNTRDRTIFNLHLVVYYVNQTDFINGFRYSVSNAAAGTTPEVINDRNYAVRTGSRVAAYWPWAVFQDWSGFINVANSLTKVPYSITQLQDAVGIQGTRLSTVPLSTDYDKIADSSYGIFYQNAEGLLTPLAPGADTGGGRVVTQSWPPVSKFPKITIPKQGAFAAFSFARPSETKEKSDLVNTYVLYQAESSAIKQVWTDDSVTWKQSSPPALAKADMGTDISCLTPAAANNTYTAPLDVAPQSNLTRCYFQRGGWVVEVQLNGEDDWDELGTLPMP